MSKANSADDDSGGKGGGDGHAPVPPTGPPLTPWDGAWELPDPNQQGSGWESHWYFQQNCAVDAPDVLTAAAALSATEDPGHDTFHRLLYADFLEHLKTVRDARLGQEVAGDSYRGLDSDNDALHAADGALPGYMAWAQDYLEFILIVRDCATSRARQGLPPALCSRNQPCDQCRRHDGFDVPSSYWHTLPPEELDIHMREYLRIRNELPQWRSRRTANLAPPSLVSGPVAEQDSPDPPGPTAPTVPAHDADPAPAPSPTTTHTNSGVPAASAPSLPHGGNTMAAPAQNTSIAGDGVHDPVVFANVGAAERFLRQAAVHLKRGPLVQATNGTADGPDDPPIFVNVNAAERFVNETTLNLNRIAHSAASFAAQGPDTAVAIGGASDAGFATSVAGSVSGGAGAAAPAQEPRAAATVPDNLGVDASFVSASRSQRETALSVIRTALADGPSMPTHATSDASKVHGWPEGVLAPVVAVNFGFMREAVAAATTVGRPASPNGSDDDVPALLEVSDSSPSESEDDDDVPPLVDISESSASETEDDAAQVN